MRSTIRGAEPRWSAVEVVAEPRARRRLAAEVWIVLGLSLGQSGVYALVSLIAKLARDTPLGEQTSALNVSRSDRSLLDLTYQLLSIGFAIVPVLLALYLVSSNGRSATTAMGFDLRAPRRDLLYGVALAAVIGLPGIGVYLLGRALDLTTTIAASALNEHWWTIPVLILAALKNAVLEEVVAVGYLTTRLRELGWADWPIIVTSALLRGSYHLYQGIGMAAGNVAMGVVFAWFHRRTGRVMPLVVAHTIIDIVSFVGYALFRDLLGLP